MTRNLLLLLFALSCFEISQAQQHIQPKTAENISASKTNKLLYEENKNQWPSQVLYKSDVKGGLRLFMEKGQFTYVKYNPEELKRIEDAKQNRQDSAKINLHAFKMKFLESNPQTQVSASEKSSFKTNYFKGNDSTKWWENINSYSHIKYKELYRGIDLNVYSNQGELKYDFTVSSASSPALVQLYFEGCDKVYINKNQLFIETSAGNIYEHEPYSYQIINGERIQVPCSYVLAADEKTVSFNFPNGYNKKYPLVIDPLLSAATYSGSYSNTYGHCATYDAAGNIYIGGETFGASYPTSIGAYQTFFAGGERDMAITKFNPDGSSIIWSTLLGGDGTYYPTSICVFGQGELYIYGITYSTNFPTTAGCFDALNLNYSSDISVTHLNNTGSALLGSTLIGGNSNDGLSDLTINSAVPYDDQRGEIQVDGSGNVYIASSTSSSNFPTTSGAYITTLNGYGYNACIFSLTSDMKTLRWSTFLGGSDNDFGISCRLNSKGDVFVTGYTTSADFPTTSNAYQKTYGGMSDGFVSKLNANGSALLASTYFGTSAKDASYLIDLDKAGTPYILGISQGNIAVSGGAYSTPKGQNYIVRLDDKLSKVQFSTRFGSPNSSSYTENYIYPSAFMIDNCGNIYASGFTSDSDYPTTSDAFFNYGDGVNKMNYFLVLTKNAAALTFGTYYYGDHIHGGVSRFDPSGKIYQAICMPSSVLANTTNNAYSKCTNTNSRDIYIYKLDFQKSGVIASASASEDTICKSGPIAFLNNSTNATS